MEEDSNTQTMKNPDDHRPSYLKKRVIVPTMIATFFILLGLYFVIHSIHYQSTDDAFVEGHIVSVAPRVSGPVVKMLIQDNQAVKKGDLLIEIDPTDYEVKLAQAKAKLVEAKASLKIAQKNIVKTKSQLNSVREEVVKNNSKLDLAQRDYDRYSSMYKEGISSKQEYETSKMNLTAYKSNYNSSIEKEKSASASLDSSISQKDANLATIQKLTAEVKAAELNLAYTKIYAPQDGLITSRSVEEGNFLQIGQPMFSIVPENVWVVANFKETQLTNMKIGQKVNIKIDTYPNKRFNGKVESIQRATGAKASLFPPENAVGSYVKIVQRIPVKIIFDEDISKYNIVPGMSVVPEVKVR